MRRGWTGWLVWGVLAGLGVGDPASLAAPQGKVERESWEGTLQATPTVKLKLVLNMSRAGDGPWSATFDSPDQGATGLKVDSVTRDKSKLAFTMKLIAGSFDGNVNATGDRAVGEWKQGGATFPLTFARVARPDPPAPVGDEVVWEGKLSVGAGLQLRMVFRVRKGTDGKLVSICDSPDQGAKGMKVDATTLDKEKLVFEMKALDGRFEGKLDPSGTEAVGTWTQRGASLPLTLRKVAKATEARRPQTPKPPFPYRAEEVAYQNAAAGVKLAGTLSIPEGEGPFPAAILISGSGAQDRDESLFEHKPFFVLADALTRRGVAVLRVDDRGVGGSTGSTLRATTEDFAGDVLAGIAFLKSRKEIATKKIGLIGHSEGGLVGPLAATKTNDVAFLVMMAGTGLPGDEILQLQAKLIAEALGVQGKPLESNLKLQKRLIEIVKAEADPEEAEAKMRAAVEAMKAELPEAQRAALEAGGGLLETSLKSLQTPWFRYFLSHDPRPALSKVRCPVLAIIGEKDLQVPPRENLAAIQEALSKGGNDRVTAKQLPGLNHLFQTAQTGSPSEYAQIEETIAPSALSTMIDWVVAQTAAP